MQGKLSTAEEQDLLQKMHVDETFKQFFIGQQKELREKVIQADNPEVEQQWNRLKSRIRPVNIKPVRSQKAILYQKALSIAAAFVFGLLISSGIYFVHFQKFSSDQQVQEISIPYGGKSKFSLPDGSLVWLNSGSKLSYPSNFKGQRSIQLEGEAYFDVIKSRKPFIVSTAYGEIEVLGTSFNVKAYTDDDFQTTLVAGAVNLRVGAGTSITLKPGEQAFVNENNRLEIQTVETEIFTSWKDGKLIFYREPFEKVAKRMERWYNVKIEVDNDEIKNLWFTGTIEMETLSEVMELIRRSMPLEYSYDQNTRTLKIEKK
ncbi:FecR family protein [Sunxiuqinia dokdonensis]|nr:FecR domain-containing protein [Sunxiuqinia dokdonensis]